MLPAIFRSLSVMNWISDEGSGRRSGLPVISIFPSAMMVMRSGTAVVPGLPVTVTSVFE